MRKITAIRTAIVEANFQWTYVRVYSDVDGGLHGTGECFFAPGLEKIVSELGRLLVGEDFVNTERLVEKMKWASSGAGSSAGIIWNAISGIEAALLDLKGKYYEIPVYQLLGGKFRDEVRIYLDCHADSALEAFDVLLQPQQLEWMEASDDEDSMLDPSFFTRVGLRAKQIAELGYTALKFDLDLPGTDFQASQGYSIKNRDIDWMVNLVSAVREGVGDEVDIAFDAHWRYKAHEILAVMREIEPFRILWIEDPLPPHDLNGLAQLRRLSGLPVATGENIQLQQGFKPLIDGNLCDIVTPDLQKAGGLLEGKKIADMSNAANKTFAPHMIGGPLALMASCHLSAAVPNFLACEFHAHDVPFFHDLCEEGTDEWFRPGWVRPMEKPGFGIELDEKVMARYLHRDSRGF